MEARRLGRIQKKILLLLLEDEERRASLPPDPDLDSNPFMHHMLKKMTPTARLYYNLTDDVAKAIESDPQPELHDSAVRLQRYHEYIRNCIRTINRLQRSALITRVKIRDGKSSAEGFNLTYEGRKAAGEIRREEAATRDLEETLRLLRAQGYTHATPDQIRETLWQISVFRFESREDFERYWTKQRLGRALKKEMDLKQVLKTRKRERRYILSHVIELKKKRKHTPLLNKIVLT